MQGPHTAGDPGLVPAPGRADLNPGEIIPTHRAAWVHTEGHWVGGTVLAWHRDARGWRCVLDWTPAPGRHYQTWIRYEPRRIQPDA